MKCEPGYLMLFLIYLSAFGGKERLQQLIFAGLFFGSGFLFWEEIWIVFSENAMLLPHPYSAQF
jgi:hypothetical protein